MATTKSTKFVNPFTGVDQTDYVSEDGTGSFSVANQAANGGVNPVAWSLTSLDSTITYQPSTLSNNPGAYTSLALTDGSGHSMGTVSINSDGALKYDGSQSGFVQSMAAGEHTTASFYTWIKSGTELAREKVTIDIAGQNDAASISGTSTGSLTEDDNAPATGTLTVSDVDHGQAHTISASGTTANGAWSVDANGHWSFTVNNAAVQHLDAGAQVTDTFVVTSQDGTAHQTVSVTINGLNDAASISGATSGSVTEDTTLTASGTLAVSDVDDGQSHATAASGTTANGAWSVDGDGHWSYAVDNAAIQHLGAADSITDTFTVSSLDGTAHQDVSVTIHGTNDIASISGDTAGSVTEDTALTASGTLAVSDVDDGQSHATAASGTTANGAWSVDGDGHWSYAVDNAAIQHLGAADSITDTFTVSSLDGTAQQDVSVTIHGTNDIASISGDTTGSVTEDTAQTASGTLAVSDVDDGQSHATAASGTSTSGSWSVDGDGHWSYAVDNAAIQHLGAADSITDTFTVSSLDGTAQQDVTITIHGTNDAAVFGGDTSGAVTEDTTLTATGTLTVSDADDGQSSVQADSGNAAHGSFTVDADGNWSYALNNSDADVQALNTGDTLSDSFIVHSADGTAQTVAITINGLDEPTSPGGAGAQHVIGNGQPNSTLIAPDNSGWKIQGNPGDDILIGGGGDDILLGGKGNDVMTGGGGNDLFVLSSQSGVDVITDFQIGHDHLQLDGDVSFGGITYSGADTVVNLLPLEQPHDTPHNVTLLGVHAVASDLFAA
jgi:VCBS repeat-containing protein